MKEYCFTVTKTGYIHVEADSLEEAEAKLKKILVTTMWWPNKLAKNCNWLGNYRRSRTRRGGKLMEEEYKEFNLVVNHKAVVLISADSEEEAIEKWNDAVAHQYDLEYTGEKPKFTGEIWEHDG